MPLTTEFLRDPKKWTPAKHHEAPMEDAGKMCPIHQHQVMKRGEGFLSHAWCDTCAWIAITDNGKYTCD